MGKKQIENYEFLKSVAAQTAVDLFYLLPLGYGVVFQTILAVLANDCDESSVVFLITMFYVVKCCYLFTAYIIY